MRVAGAIFTTMFTFANAYSVVGTVENYKGNVKIKSETSVKKNKVKSNLQIKSGDMIVTSQNAFVQIKLNDNSNIVLGESSSIIFSSINNVEQSSGKVFYKISSRDAKNSLKIKTPFAIIGVKGTTFIVNASEESSVILKEGLINIRSINDEFELVKQEIIDEFAFDKKAIIDEFNNFKEDDKILEFDLQPLKSVSFDGNTVIEQAWSLKNDAEFKYFNNLLN